MLHCGAVLSRPTGKGPIYDTRGVQVAKLTAALREGSAVKVAEMTLRSREDQTREFVASADRATAVQQQSCDHQKAVIANQKEAIDNRKAAERMKVKSAEVMKLTELFTGHGLEPREAYLAAKKAIEEGEREERNAA